MPRKEDPVPDSVKLAQQLLTRLADFSAMEENEDLYGNIKALAETVVSVGARSLSCICCSLICSHDLQSLDVR